MSETAKPKEKAFPPVLVERSPSEKPHWTSREFWSGEPASSPDPDEPHWASRERWSGE